MADASPLKHPAQLVKVDVSNVEFHAFRTADSSIDIGEFGLIVGRSNFDPKEKTIHCVAGIEAGKNDSASGKPYYLKLEVVGHFKVDDSKFTLDQIQRWAEHSAPYVILPYLREQVYAFTVRAGFLPILIPMYQVPVPVEERSIATVSQS